MRAGIGGLVVVVLAFVTRADATTVKRVSLEEAVATASEVFVGTVVGTGLKLAVCGVIAFYFVAALV